MYKTLIVDDDFIICTGLQKLIAWEEYGFEARDHALNGAEALEMMDKTAYDLVITDIRMPKLDGIGLIKEMRKKNYPAKVIILSGYRDFEYAQTAMEYGVKKYILKPVNEIELVNTVIEIKQEIDEGIRQVLALRESKTILREKLVLELLQSEDKNHSIYNRLLGVGTDLKYNVYQVCIIDCLDNHPGIIRKIVEETVGKYSEGYLADIGGNRIAVLFCCNDNCTWTVRKVCEDLFNYVNKFTRNIIHISIGNEVAEYALIHQSCQNALNISSGGFFNDNRHIVFYEEIAANNAIETIIRYVRENCCEKLTLQSIANRFYFNPAYVGRIFRNHTGMKFNEFLIACKIEKSIQLMENSKLRVSDIAEKVGYTDYDHFCKVFRSKKGCTPSEYMAKTRTS